MADITLAQMLKQETVLGVYSRLKAAGTQLSTFYGMRPESPGTERALNGRNAGWDTFDNTRTMAKGRAPYVGPARSNPKPTGHVTATLMRLYESIDIIHEKVYGTRPLGGQYGAVDRTGQSYVGRQIKYGAQRMANSMEFMVSRMFRGGFDIEITGEDHYLREEGAGTVTVDFQVSDDHAGAAGAGSRVPLLESSANVIADYWTDVNADLPVQLLNLNLVAERVSGYPITEYWINSTTLGLLFSNLALQNIGGSAYRIFDTFTGAEISTTDGTNRPSGLTVIFRACPQAKFHVYDAVLNVAGQVDSSVLADVSMYIPDGKCLATPAPGPGEWHGTAVGGEPIREEDGSEVDYKEGLHSWNKKMNDPPGTEMRSLVNTLPILYVPNAIYWLQVAAP
jgi:hypothetical protein